MRTYYWGRGKNASRTCKLGPKRIRLNQSYFPGLSGVAGALDRSFVSEKEALEFRKNRFGGEGIGREEG